jgi:redox-sensitive bicupin YhaK (pirin superfamily)
MFAGLFNGAERVSLDTVPGRATYLHLARGSLKVNDTQLSAGDALMLSGSNNLALHGGQDAEVLLFDLPGDGQS